MYFNSIDSLVNKRQKKVALKDILLEEFESLPVESQSGDSGVKDLIYSSSKHAKRVRSKPKEKKKARKSTKKSIRSKGKRGK